jgi:hypothetical protein
MHERELAKAKRGTQRHHDLRQKILLAPGGATVRRERRRQAAAQGGVQALSGRPDRSPRSGSPKSAAGSRTSPRSASRRSSTPASSTRSGGAAEERPRPVARGATYEKPTRRRWASRRRGSSVSARSSPSWRSGTRRGSSAARSGEERAAREAVPRRHRQGGRQGQDRQPRYEPGGGGARLAELDKTYEAAIKKIAPHVDPYQGDSGVMDINGRMRSVKQEEQRFRNMKSKKGGAGARYHEKQKSVGEEVRALAQDKLDELATKHPEQQFAKDIAERDRLREAIGEHKLNELGRDERQAVVRQGGVDGQGKSSTKRVPSDLPVPGTSRRTRSTPVSAAPSPSPATGSHGWKPRRRSGRSLSGSSAPRTSPAAAPASRTRWRRARGCRRCSRRTVAASRASPGR